MGLRTAGPPIKPKPFFVSYIQHGDSLNVDVGVRGTGSTLEEAISNFYEDIRSKIEKYDEVAMELVKLLPKG